MKQLMVHVAHAQSLRMCWFETTLLQHLVSWCCSHGSSLRSVVKKRQRGKVKCDSQSLLKAPIKSDDDDSIRNLQVTLLTLYKW